MDFPFPGSFCYFGSASSFGFGLHVDLHIYISTSSFFGSALPYPRPCLFCYSLMFSGLCAPVPIVRSSFESNLGSIT